MSEVDPTETAAGARDGAPEAGPQRVGVPDDRTASHPRSARRARGRALRWAVTLALVAGVTAAAFGCGSLQLTTVNVMARFGDYTLTRDIEYGDDEAHRLDVYVPRDIPAAGAPLIVFFHGGSWQFGDKAEYRFVGEALASRGLVAVVVETRLYPTVRFPTFLDDAADAVVWAHAHAEEYGADPRRLVLMGHSSGAHMAALLALDQRYLTRAGGDPAWIRGLVGLAGPYDFSPTTIDARDVFSEVEDLATTQPIHYAPQARAPALLLHGEADELVKIKNTVNLAAAIVESGGRAETRLYPECTHTTIVGALSIPLRRSLTVLDDIARFVYEVATAS